MLGMRALLVVVLISCGGKPAPASLADACFDLAVTYCDREQQCGTLTGSIGECRTAVVNGCCISVDCATPVRECAHSSTCCFDSSCTRIAIDSSRVASVFDGCEAAVRNESCGQLAAGLVPSGCAARAADAGS
jgi:hypothetical protein